ncbi:MAG: DUF1893 domain-containing protein [Caldisericaceae bacterium]
MNKCGIEELIKKTLRRVGISAVAFKEDGEASLTFTGSGVKPIYDFVSKNLGQLDKFYGLYWGDKVLGKASAFLILLLRPKYVFGGLMSEDAVKILEKNNIPYAFGERAQYIMNTKKDGMCPFEKSVLDVEDSETALKRISEVLESFRNKSP